MYLSLYGIAVSLTRKALFCLSISLVIQYKTIKLFRILQTVLDFYKA